MTYRSLLPFVALFIVIAVPAAMLASKERPAPEPAAPVTVMPAVNVSGSAMDTCPYSGMSFEAAAGADTCAMTGARMQKVAADGCCPTEAAPVSCCDEAKADCDDAAGCCAKAECCADACCDDDIACADCSAACCAAEA